MSAPLDWKAAQKQATAWQGTEYGVWGGAELARCHLAALALLERWRTHFDGLDALLADIKEAIVSEEPIAGQRLIKPCVWTPDEDGWYSTCRNYFVINEGTPADNHMHFCCYCGHPLEVEAREAIDE